VAILLVLAHQLNRIDPHGTPARIVEPIVDLGWMGVQLFFVLSGFLITGILLDDRGNPRALRDFYIRRTLRIFPLYYGALILFTLVLPALGWIPASYRDHAIWYWLYAANWTLPFLGGGLPHFWSLCVEEQFYLFWPWLVLQMDASKVLRLCIVLAVAGMLARTALRLGGTEPAALYMWSVSRIDALALGGAVAAWLRLPGNLERAIARSRAFMTFGIAAWVAGFLTTGAYPANGLADQTFGYTVLSASFAAVLLAFAARDAQGEGRSWLAGPVLTRLGLYSYGMYVFHKPLHDLVGKPALAALGYADRVPTELGLAYIATGMLATFVLGAASYHLYESRFLALRGRFTTPRPGNLPG
jgi:peptidoglycan/LPS O-acetylase OafA/YrhL